MPTTVDESVGWLWTFHTVRYTHAALLVAEVAHVEGLRCGGVVSEIPFWMPAYDGMNQPWGSTAGGFNTVLLIVGRTGLFAELEVNRSLARIQGTETSSYKLFFNAGG